METRPFYVAGTWRLGGDSFSVRSPYQGDVVATGTKESGRGREGLRYAIDEMTEPRILILSDVAL